jgi:hypothetical protein
MSEWPRVLKKRMVRAGGSRRIGDRAAAPAGAAGGKAAARIVEQSDAGAVLEVTCGCGRKTYVQCEYPAAAGASHHAEGRVEGEGAGEVAEPTDDQGEPR